MRNDSKRDSFKGIIVETEAYSQEEESCHGYKNRTKANETLFSEPGTIYVYKTYGLHFCLNIVTDRVDFASGVLIRAVFMKDEPERIASGPGLVTKRFLIDEKFNNLKIFDNKFLGIFDISKKLSKEELVQTTRIGIKKAINLKWRWYLKQSRSISKREKGDKIPPLKYVSNNLLIRD